MTTNDEATRAVWLIRCVWLAADILGQSLIPVATWLSDFGVIEWALSEYQTLHTQEDSAVADLFVEKLRGVIRDAGKE